MATVSVIKLPSCLSLNVDFLDTLPEGTNQIMVYGWAHCKYQDVECFIREMAEDREIPIRKVFNNSIGCSPDAFLSSYATTLESRQLNILAFEEPSTDRQATARQCKTALTNLVLENYKRMKDGLPVIPLLFCIDIDGNPKPWSIETITSKEESCNKQITHKELRRAYKLCTHENSKIRDAAKATFCFIKLKYLGDKTYALEPTASPWEDSRAFGECWEARKAKSKTSSKSDASSWDKQFKAHVAAYERRMADRDDEKESTATTTKLKD